MFKLNWFLRLVEMLSNQRGDNIDTSIAVEDAPADASSEEGEGGGENEDSEKGDAGDDGEGDGKPRSDHIPRERFDKVNDKAKRVDALLELGVLQEDSEGNIHLNPDHNKPKQKDEDEPGDKVTRDAFRFKKEDVDEDSWPLVEKINKGFDYYEGLAQKMVFRLGQLGSENAILRDYPEFLQKDGALRKKALDIMKNDPEFKQKYRGDPERSFWAVKRAAEALEGKSKGNPKPKKPKSKFITPKGDGGSSTVKRVDISTLTPAQLDELEKAEHERLKSASE